LFFLLTHLKLVCVALCKKNGSNIILILHTLSYFENDSKCFKPFLGLKTGQNCDLFL
jgi:hypothetical protein